MIDVRGEKDKDAERGPVKHLYNDGVEDREGEERVYHKREYTKGMGGDGKLMSHDNGNGGCSTVVWRSVEVGQATE